MKVATARRGFTLIEVLVALGLVLMLSWGMFAVVSDLGSRRDRLMEMSVRQSEAGTLFELLEGDLMCSIAADPEGRGGVAGSSNSLAVSTRGIPISDGPGPARGDLVRSQYRFDAAAGAVMLSRDGGPPERVAMGIGRIELRYFDGESWQQEFDSAERDGLPVAVEVSIWFGAASEVLADSESSRLPPDRVRQIVIPDSRAAGEGAGE